MFSYDALSFSLMVGIVVVALIFCVFAPVIASEYYCTAKGGICPENQYKLSPEQLIEGTETQTEPEETISSTGMEWFSHGVNNNDLVSQLKSGRIIKSDEVESAMRKVDRGNFCSHHPYQDSPQYIGYGVTISAPHMHAHALEMLKDKLVEGASVLDVGSGI
jgi:hypothetical protein